MERHNRNTAELYSSHLFTKAQICCWSAAIGRNISWKKPNHTQSAWCIEGLSATNRKAVGLWILTFKSLHSAAGFLNENSWLIYSWLKLYSLFKEKSQLKKSLFCGQISSFQSPDKPPGRQSKPASALTQLPGYAATAPAWLGHSDDRLPRRADSWQQPPASLTPSARFSRTERLPRCWKWLKASGGSELPSQTPLTSFDSH